MGVESQCSDISIFGLMSPGLQLVSPILIDHTHNVSISPALDEDGQLYLNKTQNLKYIAGRERYTDGVKKSHVSVFNRYPAQYSAEYS